MVMMRTEESNNYIKFASALLNLNKQSKLNMAYKKKIETTNEAFSLRHEFCSDTIAHCVRLNILNQKAYPFDYLQAKHNLPLTKNSFSKEKIVYSKMLVENCEVVI